MTRKLLCMILTIVVLLVCVAASAEQVFDLSWFDNKDNFSVIQDDKGYSTVSFVNGEKIFNIKTDNPNYKISMIMGIESNEQTHGIPLLHIIIDTGEQKINSDTITFDDYTSSAKFAVKSENGKYNIWITEETLSFFELIRMMSIRSMNIEFSGGEKLNCSVSIDLNRFLELYESYLSAGGEFQDYKPVNDEFQSSFSLK